MDNEWETRSLLKKKEGKSGFKSEDIAQTSHVVTGYVFAGCPFMCWAASGFSGLRGQGMGV